MAVALALTLLATVALPVASAAVRPRKPAVRTGRPRAVGYGSATLTGELDPHGQASYYYFQYGPTRAYGAQTPLAEAGAGVRVVPVSVPVGGLAPLTIYHYRLVGVNATGTTLGGDRAFKTTPVPLSLRIVASPDPVPFGGTVTVQGTLSGTGDVGREVVLQVNQFPFTAGFVDVGNPELTTASGGFSFVLLSAAVNSQYRVVTATHTAVVSPVVTEPVSVLVTAHHRPVRKRPHHVCIYGTLTPAENGMRVGIMRVRHGHETLAGGAVLHPDGPGHSRYVAVIRRRRGVYRVLAAINGAQSSAYSSSLLVR